MPDPTKTRYSHIQIALHWLTALLVLLMLVLGMAYSAEVLGASGIRAHQIFGQILIVVVCVRFVLSFRSKPVKNVSHLAIERITASAIHWLLYLTLFVYLFTGYVAASGLRAPMLALPVPADFAYSEFAETLLDVHFLMKWVLLSLFALHIAGVLKHHFWDKDRTFFNMWFSSTKGD